ncbi:MAG TPA: METTL5 family protein [Methanobacteriaceae archaeon]|nr:METTL5 family protein [Methanobacteriaceae archaeon]
MFTKKRHLEMALQDVPGHSDPDPDREQYLTPASIAADLVWNAATNGDVAGLKVLDLGCGTGILSLAASLMGAQEVVGVDVDEKAIEVARKQAERLHVKVRFLALDVDEFEEEGDTVIMNPPFGAQRAQHREADRRFLRKALDLAPVVYSFHLKKTEPFLEKLVKALDAKISHRFFYSFPLPRIYNFHQEEQRMVDVVVLRVERS